MAKESFSSEEILAVAKKSGGGGGGGGTTNYNELNNKPQIAGTTLSGNKSLSDLGIASEGSVSSLAGTVGSLAEVVGDSGSGLVKDVNDIEAVIPEGATSSNKLATQSDLPSAVTGNPSGSSTAGNLSKLQIGSDIYDVPSGGGSGNTVSKTRYQISSSSWSSSANSDGFYTLTTTLNPTIGSSPDVYVAGSADGTQPTDTEKGQFAYVKRCKVNGSTLTLYASSKPSSTFYIWVEGVNGTGSGDIVGNVIQPNGESSGGGFSWDSLFSTNETVIGTLGNKTLYARTFHTSNLPNNSQLLVASMNYTDIKLMFGMAYRTDTSAQYPERRPLPFAGGSTNDIRLDQTGGTVRILTFTDWSSYVADVTVIYTKTS